VVVVSLPLKLLSCVRNKVTYLVAALALSLIGGTDLVAGGSDLLLNKRLQETKNTTLSSNFPWKCNIMTTTFWIGNNKNSYTSTVNFDSAWDTSWHENYGGEDDPDNRAGSRPKNFFPKLNPFYIALPFNDVAFPDKAAKLIPWYKKEFVSRFKSVCKDKWIAVHHRGKFCFGQWQDVGPFRVDHAEYVFGNAQPDTPTGAGLDVSPAIRDYLAMGGRAACDWRFVDAKEVPYGPWIEYGEKSFVLAQLEKTKKNPRQFKSLGLPEGAKNWDPTKGY